MPKRTQLPPSASVAEATEGARLFAPSAARNATAITQAVLEHGPRVGRALEIASGTGQHMVALAGALPAIDWQPSEIDAARRASIDAYAQAAKANNIRPAIPLDAAAPGWGQAQRGYDLILTVNLLHLISVREASTLIAEAADALQPGGILALYGPFLRDGVATSDGDAVFDASLRASDPEIGYKDAAQITAWLTGACFAEPRIDAMPANNLFFFAPRR